MLVRQAQPQTAIHKALNPKWMQNAESELLRSVEFTNRLLVWAKTKDAPRGMNVPEPFRWPWEVPLDDGAIKGDSVSWEEAEERWGRDMRSRLPQSDHDEHVAFPEED